MGYLLVLLVFLLLFSGFFSASEVGMMRLNRYRLRHMVEEGNSVAKVVAKLLERSDRLLGVILIGNTFANVLASSVATYMAIHFFGEAAIFIVTVALTIVILVFAEIAPKTLAVNYPEAVAFFVARILRALLILFYPLVWLGNFITKLLFVILRIKIGHKDIDKVTHRELRTVVAESMTGIPESYQDLLLRIIDIEELKVNDVMIPRNEIDGIDVQDDWSKIRHQIEVTESLWLPVYDETIDQTKGLLDVRRALILLANDRASKEDLLSVLKDAYFIAESTPLRTQLSNFRGQHTKTAIVVDEYGDIQGLLTLEDLLEEIVGDLNEPVHEVSKNIVKEKAGSYLVSGHSNLRDLNRLMDWAFDVGGAKTLNGAIVDYLESIPVSPLCLRLSGYPIEIVRIKDNLVKQVRIWPDRRQSSKR